MAFGSPKNNCIVFVATIIMVATMVISPVTASTLAPRSHKKVSTLPESSSSSTSITSVKLHRDPSLLQVKKPTRRKEGVYVDKPVLRGQFHKWGAILYPVLFGIPLHLRALKTTSTSSEVDLPHASLLFSFAVESIMVVSATFHTYPWKTNTGATIARKLDFTAIFFGIASLYSSMGRLLMGHNPLFLSTIEPLVWACAVVGTLLKWSFRDLPSWANVSVFLIQGWAATPCIPTLVRNASVSEACGLVGGGIFVTLGALAFGTQWPRNVHNKAQHEIVFGHHELFHVGTLLMVVSFWYTMWSRMAFLQE